MRFWDVESGTISFQKNQKGVNVADIITAKLRKNIGYMTQETFLFEDTIAANIKLAKPEVSEEEMIAAAKKASIHDFITGLPEGYDTMVTELGASLSGGEKQRIGLARASLHPC